MNQILHQRVAKSRRKEEARSDRDKEHGKIDSITPEPIDS